MYQELKRLASQGRTIRVGLVGAGAMGRGIAWQIARAPAMELCFIGDLKEEAGMEAAKVAGKKGVWRDGGESLMAVPEGSIVVTDDALSLLEGDNDLQVDVLVEATNSIGPAAEYCFAAIARKAHVVLMNAEVDLAVGPLLQSAADAAGVVVTSDAGDQHGVLATMIDEIKLWGFDIVQAGNIKGFLNRYATAEELVEEAAKRDLDPIQCCAYTDGTKLNIEMALIANGLDLVPTQRGMTGPRCEQVTEVLDLFDFSDYPANGAIDYILGAEPGGGVYVVGRCEDPVQAGYLSYYKLGMGPEYLFYRPYHLCHLETPLAIVRAVLHGEAILKSLEPRKNEVYTFAKKDLKPGDSLGHGIGGDEVYGLVDTVEVGGAAGMIPITWLEPAAGEPARMLVAKAKDEPILVSEVERPDGALKQFLDKQEAMHQVVRAL